MVTQSCRPDHTLYDVFIALRCGIILMRVAVRDKALG